MALKEAGAGGAYRVETPEQIELAYDVAGLGSRFLATLVDTVIQTVLLGVIWFVGGVGLAVLLELVGGWAPGTAIRRAMEAGAVLGTFATLWGYHVFFEMVWHGQTPGKRWLGLRVIKEGGYPIGFVDSVIRNVVRLVDFLPFYYGIGAVVMFVDRRARRLGDLAAGTLVVKERRELRLDSVTAGLAAPTEGAFRRAPELARLTAADQSLLREYLRRRPTLTIVAAEALAARLAGAIAEKIGRAVGPEGPDGFLVRLGAELGWGGGGAAGLAGAETDASDGQRPRRRLREAILTPLGVILLGALALLVGLALFFWPENGREVPLAPTPTAVEVGPTPRPGTAFGRGP